MGCISSKNVVARAYSPSPTMVEISESIRASSRGHSGLTILDSKGNVDNERNNNSNIKIKKNSSKKSNGSFSLRHGLVHRNVEAEQNAVGWPPWLTAVAAEAIQGWIPLKADSFQKLEKVTIIIIIIIITLVFMFLMLFCSCLCFLCSFVLVYVHSLKFMWIINLVNIGYDKSNHKLLSYGTSILIGYV